MSMMSSEQQTKSKALGYLRISDKKQIQGESPKSQREFIERYAATNNIEVVGYFYDEAKSGKNTERAELHNMLREINKRKGEIRYVIVYRMNRASRNLESYLTTVRSVLAAKGVKIRSATEQFDDSAHGQFMEQLHVMLGELENNVKSETVTDVMVTIAKMGYWQHGPIRGYDCVRILTDEDKKRPSFMPNHEAPLITKILMRFNEGGYKISDICRYANTLGFKTLKGRPTTQDFITKLLKRPEYAGYVHDKFTNHELVDGKHEGLISKEVYWENQELLTQKSAKNLLGLKHNVKSENSPLRRFVKCANCTKYMTSTNPGGKYRYYCPRKTCRSTGSVLNENLHDEFKSLLNDITPKPGALRLMKEIITRTALKERGNIQRDADEYRSKVEMIDSTRTKAIKKNVEGSLSDEDYRTLSESLTVERLGLAREIANLEEQQVVTESSIDFVINKLADMPYLWDESTLEMKHKLQSLIFPEGFSYDIKRQEFIINKISPLYGGQNSLEQADFTENSIVVILRRIELRLPG